MEKQKRKERKGKFVPYKDAPTLIDLGLFVEPEFRTKKSRRLTETEMETEKQIATQARNEELKAAEQYSRHLGKSKDPRLRKILKHNRKDELKDHARRLKGYLDGL